MNIKEVEPLIDEVINKLQNISIFNDLSYTVLQAYNHNFTEYSFFIEEGYNNSDLNVPRELLNFATTKAINESNIVVSAISDYDLHSYIVEVKSIVLKYLEYLKNSVQSDLTYIVSTEFIELLAYRIKSINSILHYYFIYNNYIVENDDYINPNTDLFESFIDESLEILADIYKMNNVDIDLDKLFELNNASSYEDFLYWLCS